jgi:hypothetical protein
MLYALRARPEHHQVALRANETHGMIPLDEEPSVGHGGTPTRQGVEEKFMLFLLSLNDGRGLPVRAREFGRTAASSLAA